MEPDLVEMFDRDRREYVSLHWPETLRERSFLRAFANTASSPSATHASSFDSSLIISGSTATKPIDTASAVR